MANRTAMRESHNMLSKLPELHIISGRGYRAPASRECLRLGYQTG